MLLSRNLFLCVHLETNSVLLFNNFLGSDLAIIIFSVKHKSRFLVPNLYGDAYALMLHCKLYSAFSSFNFYKYFDNSVSFTRFLCLNDMVWLFWRKLNSPWAVPKYYLHSLLVTTLAWYTMHSCKHFSSKGQLSLTLQ